MDIEMKTDREDARAGVIHTLEQVIDLVRANGFHGYVLVAMNDYYPADIIIDPKPSTMERAKKFVDDATRKVVAIKESEMAYG